MTKLLVPSIFFKYSDVVATEFYRAIRIYWREPDAIERVFWFVICGLNKKN